VSDQGGNSQEGYGDVGRARRGSAPHRARQRYECSQASQAIGRLQSSLWRLQFRANFFYMVREKCLLVNLVEILISTQSQTGAKFLSVTAVDSQNYQKSS